MSPEDVLEETGMGADAVSEAPVGKQITASVNIPGLPEDISVIYSFSDDQLVSVQYIAVLDDSEAADICELLSSQAGSFMPAPRSDSI